MIGAAEWSDFEKSYRGRRASSCPVTSQPGRFRPLWSDWEMDAICRFTRLPASKSFRLVTRGNFVQPSAYLGADGTFRPEVMRQIWASGVTIQISNFEDFSNPLLFLSRNLEAAFRCPVKIHLLFTPGQAQGLAAHVDDVDILVLQVQGAKTWEIYPLNGKDGLAHSETAAFQATDAPTETTLHAGGWLLLQKGRRHEVRNKGVEPSAHFSICFLPLTLGDVFQHALDKARLSVPAFEQGLAAGGEVAEAAPMGELLLSILRFAESPDSYYQNYRCLGEPVPKSDLVARGILDAVDEGTRFVWRKDSVRIDVDKLDLDLAYRRSPLPLRSELAPIIDKMRQADTFHPTEVGIQDPQASVLLCKFLANVGVLAIAGDAG